MHAVTAEADDYQVVRLGQRAAVVELGCDSICLKDMAALLKPQPAYDIVSGITGIRVAETLPIAFLLGASIGLVLLAEPVLGYTRAAADALHDPVRYIEAVMGARPVEVGS